MTPVEIAANALNTISILLAGRNSVHTWWTGIIGCALFGWVFYDARLYADSALQVFFIAASVAGWRNWQRREGRPELPIRRTPPRLIAWLALAGVAVTAAYSYMLWHYTDAAAPVPDSVVLTFSVLAQFFGPDAINNRLILIETVSFTTTPAEMLESLTRIIADRSVGAVFFGSYHLMDFELMGGDARAAIIAESGKRGMTPFLPPLVPFGSRQWPTLVTPGTGPATLADLP